MLNLAQFAEPTERNAMVVQRALRMIDSEPLATALVGLPVEVQEIVFRNMSPRATALLREDMGARAQALPSDIAASRDLFAHLLARAQVETDTGSAPGDVPAPGPLDLATEASLVEGLVGLAAHLRAHGVLSLEGLAGQTGDPFLDKGLQLVLEGGDPLLIRSLLERHKEARLRQQAVRMDLIIEGVDALATQEGPSVVREKLQAVLGLL